MKVLVTGGAGYIGSHTCKELACQGHTPVVYDNLSTGHREFVKWGDFIHGDILDTQRLRACLRDVRPDGVIHFAAFAYVGESMADPGKYFRNNVVGTLSILDAMRDEGVKNIIVSSTCAVYGQPDQVPIVETSPTNPINPYGASKLFMERMLADYQTAHGLRWTDLRYFNAAGCDAEGEIGEWHEPETHLVPRVLWAALGKIDCLDIFGNDYETRDGTCIRDYIHVTDLAEAHILALKRLVAGHASRAFNLGTGKGHSVREIVECAKEICGRAVPFQLKPRRPGDPAVLVADAMEARKNLGWTCRHSALPHILETALQWSNASGH